MQTQVATQAHNLPLLATPSHCANKTFIVTGANVGLGLEAAKHLASLGAGRVILAVRDVTKGEAAKAEIEGGLQGKAGGTGVVSVWQLDLESYDSVKAFVKKAEAELERIDAVIENAALAPSVREVVTVNGEGVAAHVKAVTVNVLGTLLLAVLLVPVMRAKAAKLKANWEEGNFEDGVQRLVIVTSRGAFDDNTKGMWEKIREDPIKGMDAEDMFPVATYPLSKLATTFATRHLARVIAPLDQNGSGVIINLVCPGLCITTLGRNASPEHAERLRNLHKNFGRTAEDGSRTLLHAAVAGPESHGHLLHSCVDGEPDLPDWVKSDFEEQKHTWEVIAKELEAIEPGCVSKL
ncbi:uncharacterized protein C8A04DRAFT_38648 [Dichotomopilus funicola]|uniref:Uncharacterized protein n=1 Tax=Dichotomopilus funicola TaxID=1934379 RepID=A0AAN6UZB3_9PEZI|nr:hypothetical protein C8A04DRAFT_38648 [Dichotomopilus funicola]